MMNNIVTLYIDDTSIRLLVIDSKRIKKWAYLSLEPGLVEGGVIIKKAEVAAKTKQLLKDQKVRAKRVIIGLSGLLCLTRPLTLPEVPKVMLNEAVTREAKRVLPLSLEQLYVNWQTIPSPKGGIRVFLIALRRKVADSALKTLHQAGLKPCLMDLKPLSLARVVKEPTAVIVDVQPTEFDIVIMAEGIPQPIRTMPLPKGALSWQDKLPMIRDELDRTIKFHNSNNPEKPLVPSVPIFVSGELADKPELYQFLSDELGFPVSPLTSPLKCPEQLDSKLYMTNIGLALKELPSGKESGLSVNLNALPATYQPKPPPLTKIIAIPAVALITVFLLIPMVMRVQDVSANTISISSQLDTTNQIIMQKILQKQELVENIAELEGKIAEAETANTIFNNALTSLREEGINTNIELRTATGALPSTVELTSINYTDNLWNISGKAPGEMEVLSYATNLNASGKFSEITVAKIKSNQDEGMDFTLILKVRGEI